ncbi:MAG: isopentenyl phosphate kinase [Sulfolobales archaeon]|nr:isopentenyl phosphate kinase [Sulfolobales archaeon]MCX8208970.1 isopentenyl phosphate kinase [Sulfolobales archaeon]MDW8010689.1 isopentenyl phosphate kinase [Sulfolobales archaeon]
MERRKIKVVKLGGSVITVKDAYRSLRVDVVRELIGELSSFYRDYGERYGLVVIHGGGSFGHPVVKECISRYGAIYRDCYTATADSMDTLNYVIRKYAVVSGLPAVSLPPRSFCFLHSGRLTCFTKTLSDLLSKELVPLTYGDVVSSDRGFEVLSGDTLAWYIASKLDVDEILFVTDVDGLYNSDPKVNPSARKIVRAHVDEVLGFLSQSSSNVDTTGGMKRKIYEGKALGVKNIKVKILSGFIKGDLYRALTSNNFAGSVVWY